MRPEAVEREETKEHGRRYGQGLLAAPEGNALDAHDPPGMEEWQELVLRML